MAIGADYSGARPGGAAFKAAGVVGVGRYLGGATYGITNAEIADLTANGIKIWLVYEPGDTQQMAKGYEQGKADAQAAQALLNGLDLPHDMVIYSAADFDAANVLDAVMEYQRGWVEVLGIGRAGIYGGGNTLLRARQNNVASHFWQAAGWAGASTVPVESGDGGRFRMPFIDIYQVYGNVMVDGTDKCLIFTDNYGQNGASTTSSGDDDMKALYVIYCDKTGNPGDHNYGSVAIVGGIVPDGWRQLSFDMGPRNVVDFWTAWVGALLGSDQVQEVHVNFDGFEMAKAAYRPLAGAPVAATVDSAGIAAAVVAALPAQATGNYLTVKDIATIAAAVTDRISKELQGVPVA